MTNKIFVGRGNQLNFIQEWFNKTSPSVVLITGKGGIGKSSLLQKIEKEFLTNNHYIIDFFDLAEQPTTLINQALHLVSSIGENNFPKFLERLDELETVSEDIDSENVEIDAVNLCTQEISKYLENNQKTLLRIIDTYEISSRYEAYGKNWTLEINEILKNIPGIKFILASRDEFEGKDIFNDVFPKLIGSFGYSNILHVPLTGLNETEAEDFFAESDKHRIIPQDMREKLRLLTDGRPILLSLAVEWLQMEIPLPIMTEKSYSELNDLFQSDITKGEMINDFEFELIAKVRYLKSPLDIATLYMAHLDRRMDNKLLSILLEGEGGFNEYFQELKNLSFVKEYIGSAPSKCTLHDEMRNLVNKHAWNYLDISGDERKRLTQKVIDKYYQPEINSLKQKKQELLRETQTSLLQKSRGKSSDQERWLLEAETVYYYSKISETKGFEYFDKVFYDGEDNYIRDQFLLDDLKRSRVDKYKFALREADVLRRSGQLEDAKIICLRLLKTGVLDATDQIHAYNIIGTVDTDRNPVVAVDSFQKALELSKLKDDFRYIKLVHNNLGQLYRKAGQFRKAIHHYVQALELARISGDAEVGTIRNNLAAIYCLNGYLDHANTMCVLSIAEHQKRGQEKSLAFACLTKADIDRYKGDIESAERYARRAQKLFYRLENAEGSAQAYRALANISRYQFNFEQALNYLKRGILLVENGHKHSFLLLANLYQLYGRTYRHYAMHLRMETESKREDHDLEVADLYRDAVAALKESIRLALRAGNQWEVARSKIEIVIIKLLSKVDYNESDLNTLLDEVWQTSADLDDDLLKSYVYENRAYIELQNTQYFKAGFSFGEAALFIVRRMGREATKTFDRLQNILLNQQLTVDQNKLLAKGMYEKISRVNYKRSKKLTSLLRLCEQVMETESSEGQE